MNGVAEIPLAGRPLTVGVATDPDSRRPLVLRNFFAGQENRLCEVAVRAALERPANGFNPLYFYGPPLSGKSHLAQGIVAKWRSDKRTTKIVNRTAADFSWEYAAAIENRSLEEMTEEYRTADLLVLENLHHLAGKTAAQLELTRTIDGLISRGGRLVITALELPQKTPGLAPQLRSRCASGLCVPVALPAESARREILRQLARFRGMRFGEDVLESLAEGLAGNVRELLSALVQLESEYGASDVSLESVTEFLRHRESTHQPRLEEIAKRVAAHFGVTSRELRGRSRRTTIVTARSVIVYLTRSYTNLSLKKIGAYFGNRDHTTMLHAMRRAEDRIKNDHEFRQAVEQLSDQLGGKKRIAK